MADTYIYKGASIKYVRRFFGFLDPSPLYVNSRNLAYWACTHFGLHPLPSALAYLMEAPLLVGVLGREN